MEQEKGPQPINTWLESLTSQVNSARNEGPELKEIMAQKDEAILVLLAKLALVYWRPDFSPAQAKELYAQYLDDLRDLPFSEIVDAVEKYRRNPENKFFPTPGQLRGAIVAVPSWSVGSTRDRWKELMDANQKETDANLRSISRRQDIMLENR
jgi:hypothetical protein